MQITGAQLFVKALKEEGVEVLFGYPGGQAIDLFDALHGETGIRSIFSPLTSRGRPTPPTATPAPPADPESAS